MKYLLVLLTMLGLLSCIAERHTSLDALKIEDVDHIPYLMHTRQIDSVLEIVTYGSYASAKEKDTVISYMARGNTISENVNSFMCCYNTYEYDSLDLLVKRSVFTDYSTNFNLSYKREGNTITLTEKGSYNDSHTYVYTLENERVVAKSTAHKIDKDYTSEIRYFYNDNGQLIKKHSESKNDPDNGYDYKVTLKAYAWADSILKATNVKQFYNDGKDFYETLTAFDETGFPASRIILQNKDTICKTIIVKR